MKAKTESEIFLCVLSLFLDEETIKKLLADYENTLFEILMKFASSSTHDVKTTTKSLEKMIDEYGENMDDHCIEACILNAENIHWGACFDLYQKLVNVKNFSYEHLKRTLQFYWNFYHKNRQDPMKMFELIEKQILLSRFSQHTEEITKLISLGKEEREAFLSSLPEGPRPSDFWSQSAFEGDSGRD